MLPANSDERISALRRAAPVMYDFIIAHNMQWGSMTLAWGKAPGEHASAQYPSQFNDEHGLVYSQRTDGTLDPQTRQWKGEAAELIVARMYIPKPRTTQAAAVPRFNERGRSQRVSILKRIYHPGDVNRVRSLPAQTNLVVTHTESPTVFVWDTDKQPHRPQMDSPRSSTPDLELPGHRADCAINALDTSGASQILSGGQDGLVLMWNIKDADGGSNGNQLQARWTLSGGHQGPVEDCCFHPLEPTNACCSVGRDRSLILWDGRRGGPSSKTADAHSDDVNAVSWSALDPTKIITGGSDKRVHLFDVRRMERPAASIVLSGSVTNVSWSPHTPGCFAVTDEDSTVRLFRCEGAGMDLLFCHLGHRSPANDLQWCPSLPWVLCSVSDDSAKAGGGMLQAWRVSEFVVKDPDVDVEWAGAINATLMGGARSRTNSVASNSSVNNNGNEDD